MDERGVLIMRVSLGMRSPQSLRTWMWTPLASSLAICTLSWRWPPCWDIHSRSAVYVCKESSLTLLGLWHLVS